MSKYRKAVVPLVLFAIALGAFFVAFGNRDLLSISPLADTFAVEMVSGVQVDASAEVFITDNGSYRIVRLNPQGEMKALVTNNGWGSDAFSFVKSLALQDESSYYVHDIVWNENGLQVQKERILKYRAKDDRFVTVLYERDYGDNCPYVSKLNGLTYFEGSVYFTAADHEGIAVNRVNTGDGADSQVRYAPFPGGDARIQDACYSPDADILFFVDKQGVVYFDEGSGPKTLTSPASGDSVESFHLPYALSSLGDTVYFADIGSRSVYAQAIGGEPEEYALMPEEAFADRPVPRSMDAVLSDEGSTILALSDSWYLHVEIAGQGAYLDGDSVPISTSLRVTIVLVWLCAACFVVCALCLLVMLVKHIMGKKLSMEIKLSIVALLAAVITALCITPSVLSAIAESGRVEIYQRLRSLAVLSQNMLDGAAVERLGSPQDYSNEDYEQVRAELQTLINFEDKVNANVYADIYLYRDNVLYSIMFADNSVGAFYPLAFSYEGSEAQQVFETGEIVTGEAIDTSGSFIYAVGPIFDEGGEVVAAVDIGVEAHALGQRVSDQIENTVVNIVLTVTVLFFVLTEGIALVNLLLRKRELMPREEKALFPVRFVRPVAFILFITYNLTTGFAPIYAAKFGVSIFGLPPEFCAALPLTLNQLMCAVSSVLSGYYLQKLRPRWTFALGSAVCIAGEILTSVAPSFAVMTVGMTLAGIGAGALLATINMIVASQDDAEEKAKGFNIVNAASFAGMNTGIVIGGVLAVAFGQAAVYLVVAFGWAVTFAIFGYITFGRSDAQYAGQDTAQPKKSIARLIFRPRVLLFMIFALLPFVVQTGYLYYYIPIYGASVGMIETRISLLFVLNGMFVYFIGSGITDRLSRRFSSRSCIFICNALSIGAILLGAFFQNLQSVLVVLAVLGISSSIGYAHNPLYYLELEEVKEYDVGKALGAYSLFENIGDSIKPLIFSALMAAGITVGFSVFAVLSAASVFVFGVASRGGKRAPGAGTGAAREA